MSKKTLQGKIVSNKMDKTVVVEVKRVKQHPSYKKRYEAKKRYKAHDENNRFKQGDQVIIEQTRPLSKDKRWRVVEEVRSEK